MTGARGRALPVGDLDRGWPWVAEAAASGCVEPVVGSGDECVLWRVSEYLVRCSPPHRDREQLDAAYRRATWLNRRVPEIVPPVPAVDGALVYAVEDGSMAVWPFVPGRHLDRDSPAERGQAATLLARLHAAGRRADGSALLHGDFYRRNLLVRDGCLVALVDVDDVAPGWPREELAWATLELCKTPDGCRVCPQRAREFVRSYAQAGGAVVDEPLVGFMLERVRGELEANGAADADADLEYLASISSVAADLRTWPGDWPLGLA